MVIDQLAKEVGPSVQRGICQAVTVPTQLEGQPVLLAKPQTYMNRSGLACACLTRSYEIPPDHMLVIVDDFALPLGKLRLRLQGSDGGHNGLKSIIETLGTREFPRLRLGIHPTEGEIEDPVEFVLAEFAKEEREPVMAMIDRAATAIRAVLREGVARAMTTFN
jgi:PTH1 family peptidyl-tRNA hydrolase